ncbi:MAG: diguanylate cyclase [Solobacterium sp.]|nr:diguanylate cyclase [Solobacterium sp.]
MRRPRPNSRITELIWHIIDHKKKDMEFRLGGDEFLVIIKDTPEEEVISMLEELSRPITVDDGFEISISSGYGPTMKLADEALYQVKEHGRKGFMKLV